MLSAVKYANGIFYPGCVNDETMPEHPGDCLSVITIWIGTFGLVFGHFP